MKIAYLLSHRPDFLKRLVAYTGPDPLILSADKSGRYDPTDLAKLADVDALMASNEPVTEQVLAAAPRVKIIQRFGVGYEKLDLDAAARRGIPCCNLAGVNKASVAEHGMLLLLALARNLMTSHALTQKGLWGEARLSMHGSFEMVGKTLGIFGLGNTGFELAKRARVFGMRILYNDIREISPENIAAVEATFREKTALLAEADMVSVNVNFTPSAVNLLDASAISLMKPGALLVCCARGGVIDEKALAEALNEGRLAGAGLDVFSEEPIPVESPLLQAKNLITTPHMAGVTQEARDRNFEWAFENVRRVVEDGDPPQWVVNGVAP